jgi:hypothetical protein
MKELDKENKPIHLCQKCNIIIPFGTPYYSIVRSLEFRCVDEESENGEIVEVIEAEEIISLCKSCGSYFNTEGLETILKHLPIPGQEARN